MTFSQPTPSQNCYRPIVVVISWSLANPEKTMNSDSVIVATRTVCINPRAKQTHSSQYWDNERWFLLILTMDRRFFARGDTLFPYITTPSPSLWRMYSVQYRFHAPFFLEKLLYSCFLCFISFRKINGKNMNIYDTFEALNKRNCNFVKVPLRRE